MKLQNELKNAKGSADQIIQDMVIINNYILEKII